MMGKHIFLCFPINFSPKVPIKKIEAYFIVRTGATDSHGGGKMAIEAMTGVMSVQAQSVAAPKPVTMEKTEAPASQAAQAVDSIDKSVSVVENTREKGEAGNQKEQADNEQIRKAVEKLNKNMAHSEAVFGIHEDTNRVTIKIVDRTTKEVIKELPPEKTLDMIAKVWELAGIMVDEKR